MKNDFNKISQKNPVYSIIIVEICLENEKKHTSFEMQRKNNTNWLFVKCGFHYKSKCYKINGKSYFRCMLPINSNRLHPLIVAHLRR